MKQKLSDMLGADSVTDAPETLESCAADKSFAAPMTPRMVVRPQNAEQVEQLVRWANQTKTPLVPVSSGGPHYRGDTVPSVPEAVIADLSGMKKVLSINRQHRMAVVEPGVTYGELLEALAKEGLTISMPLSPKADKSVVASVLEVEPRLNANHQWNFQDPLRCVEVVWGDGNRMLTGEAGGGAPELKVQWESQKWQVEPTGPMMLDFYRLLTSAQGSMGIVTWASLKCEILPQVHNMFFVPAEKQEKLIDFMYNVIRLRFSDELMMMNSTYLACLMGHTPDEVYALMRGLPAYVVPVGVAGRDLLPEERAAAQEADIADIAQKHGLSMKAAVPGVSGRSGDAEDDAPMRERRLEGNVQGRVRGYILPDDARPYAGIHRRNASHGGRTGFSGPRYRALYPAAAYGYVVSRGVHAVLRRGGQRRDGEGEKAAG